MEFEYLGQHCQYENCNQKDFLPFHCNSCQKMLCLIHRSAAMHQCINIAMKDITSMDCPICNNCIKFDKSQDPNLIWDDHYMNKCSQQPKNQTSKSSIKCYKTGCRTILGPSNTLVCHQCQQKICLTHRLPEEHQCNTSLNRRNYVNHKKDVSNNTSIFEDNKQNITLNRPIINSNSNNTKNTKTSKIVNNNAVTNTLKGTAYRRIQEKSLQGSTTSSTSLVANENHPIEPTTQKEIDNEINVLNNLEYICPFCQIKSKNEIDLIDHINVFHPFNESNSNPNNNITSSNSIDAQQNDHSNQYFNTTTDNSSIHNASSNNNNNIHNNNTNNQNIPYNNESHYREVCPICQLRFADAIALVHHFESTHHNNNNTSNNNNINNNNNSSTYGKQCKLS